MQLSIETEQEEDGRWLGEVPELPGVLAYGQSRQEAIIRVQVLALRVLADRIEHGEHLHDRCFAQARAAPTGLNPRALVEQIPACAGIRPKFFFARAGGGLHF